MDAETLAAILARASAEDIPALVEEIRRLDEPAARLIEEWFRHPVAEYRKPPRRWVGGVESR